MYFYRLQIYVLQRLLKSALGILILIFPIQFQIRTNEYLHCRANKRAEVLGLFVLTGILS